MILSLVFLGLIFGIALAQSSQGFYNALIMMVLTLICCAAAVGLHEYVAINFIAPYWKPEFAHALAMGLLFGIPLLILRLVFDNAIKRTCLMSLWVDRIGGGICGLVTSLVIVGMMAVAVQLVPFGSEGFMGFARVPSVTASEAMNTDADGADRDAAESELWFAPDRFALAAASLMSGGVFSGERPFYNDYPDYIQTVGWANSAPLGVSAWAPPKGINFVASELVPTVFRETLGTGSGKDRGPSTYEPIEPKSGFEFRMIRVGLADRARDERKTHLFTLRQFRLVGTGADGLPAQFPPVAMQQQSATESVNRHVRFIKGKSGDIPVLDEPVIPRDMSNQVEIVFELPKGFTPSFVEYKRGARAAVSFTAAAPRRGDTGGSEPSGSAPAAGERAPAPTGTTSAQPAPAPPPSGRKPRAGTSPTTAATQPDSGQPASSGGGETVPNSGRGGNVRGATTLVGQSGFGDTLPMEMKEYRELKDTQIERSTLKNGHLVGDVDKQSSGGKVPVRKFEVPDDKRLLQLHTQKLQARSGLGRAMTFASSVVQSYVVVDDRGNQYPVVGKYGIADVNGTKTIEVQYFPEQTQVMGGFGAFDKIKDDDLKGDYQFVLLFLVDPGTRIVSFSTGGSASRADDLGDENLVAPR